MSVLALVSNEIRAALERKAPLHRLEIAFIESASELAALLHEGRTFSVAILPATVPDKGIWALWGQITLLNPRPEILICAPSADFPTWAGVLDAGGYDILVEPYSAEEFLSAVIDAEKTFQQRLADGADEVS
jgi:DNA-binding NtrC family response regulator